MTTGDSHIASNRQHHLSDQVLANTDCQTERRHKGLRRAAAPLGGRAYLLVVWPQPRRLAKDFENLVETLATFVTLASIQLALRAACQGAGPDAGRIAPTMVLASDCCRIS